MRADRREDKSPLRVAEADNECCPMCGRKLRSSSSSRSVASAKTIFERMVTTVRKRRVESLWVALLDSEVALMSVHEIARGVMNRVLFEPSEIFRLAVRRGAYYVIIIHNHPHASANPSREDIELTRQTIAAGMVLGIYLLDHIIIGDEEGGWSSLAVRYPRMFRRFEHGYTVRPRKTKKEDN